MRSGDPEWQKYVPDEVGSDDTGVPLRFFQHARGLLLLIKPGICLNSWQIQESCQHSGTLGTVMSSGIRGYCGQTLCAC